MGAGAADFVVEAVAVAVAELDKIRNAIGADMAKGLFSLVFGGLITLLDQLFTARARY